MLSTVFVSAPAGIPGAGSVVARPRVGTAVRAALPGAVAGTEWTRVSATGLPSVAPEAALRPAGMAPRFRGGAALGVDGCSASLLGATNDPITQHDGTTPLGDHPSRRPLS